MLRKLLIVSLLIAAVPLAWEFVPIQVKVWDGGFELTVNVTTLGGPLRSVSCQAFGRRDEAEQIAELLLSPYSQTWSAVSDPFSGKPLKVQVAVSGRDSPSGRKLRRYQFRYLVVIGTFQDGRQVGKVVEIPDCRESREVNVSLP